MIHSQLLKMNILFQNLMQLFAFFNTQDELYHNVHEQNVTSIQVSKDCKMIATSADYGGAIWKICESQTENPLSLELRCV